MAEQRNDYIADDRFSTPEYLERIRNMTDEEFAQHIRDIERKES